MASECLDRDHYPIFAQVDAFLLVPRSTRGPGLGWEEIVKKKIPEEDPDLEAINVAKRWES